LPCCFSTSEGLTVVFLGLEVRKFTVFFEAGFKSGLAACLEAMHP